MAAKVRDDGAIVSCRGTGKCGGAVGGSEQAVVAIAIASVVARKRAAVGLLPRSSSSSHSSGRTLLFSNDE